MDNNPRPFEIHRELVDAIDRGRRCALAVILRADGSTPQKAGIKAIIEADGAIRGTLGGGAVEGEAQRLGAEACRLGEALICNFDLAETYAREAGPICGGTMRILIDPAIAKYRESYAAAAQALKERRRGALVTRFVVPPSGGIPDESGTTNMRPASVNIEWHSQDSIEKNSDSSIFELAGECLKKETAQLFEAGEMSLSAEATYVEPVIPPPVLIVAGGGHIGQALARLAVFHGFEAVVIDDRPEFTSPALYPAGLATRCGDVAREIAAAPMDPDTHVVIVTRGHRHDAEALEACIHRPAGFIGMIGSRRKVALIRRDFIERGLATAEAFDRVFAPIGLDIGAITVPEIATSIMAQVIAFRRQGEAAARRGGMARS